MRTSTEDDAAAAKATSTLQAKFAMHGIVLRPSTENGRPVLIASQYGWCRVLEDHEAAERFLAYRTGRKVTA